MRTCSNKLLVGIGSFLLVCGLTALASGPVIELDTPQAGWPLGGQATLDVTIDPILVGGHGELWAQVEGETATYVKSFSLSSPEFTISAAVTDNTSHLGKDMDYWFDAFDAGGGPAGTCQKKRRPIVEPEME